MPADRQCPSLTKQGKPCRGSVPEGRTCGRCHRPWKFVECHTAWYALDCADGWGRGCFPLCEGCWESLGTPDARMPYYEGLIAADGRSYVGYADEIRAAVRKGG